MLLYNCFQVDEENHERLAFASPGFPYVCVHSDLYMYPDRQVSWHWHTSCEIVVVKTGTIELRTPDQTLNLRPGDAAFVNSGVPHMYRPLEEPHALQYAHLFHADFLFGAFGSVFEEKYVSPVTRCRALQCLAVHPDSQEHLVRIAALLDAVEQARKEPVGYEFAIRNRLSDFWLGLFLDTRELRASAPAQNSVDTERIKRMMDFIWQNYAQPLTVEQIGAAAGVGGRECNRCFRRSIGVSPIEHLTGIRVRKAAEMLSDTPKTVLEVSEECGFSSPSYFGKVFRESMGCTPKAYQKKMQKSEK